MKTLYINGISSAIKVTTADTFIKRFIGLMGKKPIANTGLLIISCNSIHTFFMRFNLDLVFLDADNKAVKIIHNLPPWRITLPVHNASNVLELIGNTLQNMPIQPGDIISFN